MTSENNLGYKTPESNKNISTVSAIRNYVEESQGRRHPQTRRKIVELLQQQEPLTQEKILYRGVKSHFPTNMSQFIPYFPVDFFSTSSEYEQSIAFMHKRIDCCHITIYVQPGIRVVDVTAFLEMHQVSLSLIFAMEAEWLVENNGQFFANKEKTIPGFARTDTKNHFVTYYFPVPTVSELLTSVPTVKPLKHCTGSGCTIMGGKRTLHRKRSKNEKQSRKQRRIIHRRKCRTMHLAN